VIEVREELARASAMLDVRRFDEASALLARLVSAEPESSRAWCLMARAHLGAERYTEAISAANRAVSLDPVDEWPHRLASNALVHLGNFPDAVRAADEACRLAPGYWQTHVCVAQAALAGQRLGVAAEAATRARALAPNEPDVHFLSGKVSLARGQLAEAREHQEQALALDPAHSGAMNELGRIRLRRHDTAGAIRHFISAARATPEERIYSRNIDVVLLRTVSRTIYMFTLVALILIWIPAVTHVDRLPFVIALGMAAGLTAASFAWIVLRMPREARQLVRRTLRGPRVAAALALATGGVAVAFGLVAFAPEADLTEILPVAVVITVAARLAAFAALRGAARKHLRVILLFFEPGDVAHRPQGEHRRAAQQAVDGAHAEDHGRPERGGQRPERRGGHPHRGGVQGHRDVRQRVAERADGRDHDRPAGAAAEGQQAGRYRARSLHPHDRAPDRGAAQVGAAHDRTEQHPGRPGDQVEEGELHGSRRQPGPGSEFGPALKTAKSPPRYA
jgi:Flp pilus assembly protein TadD